MGVGRLQKLQAMIAGKGLDGLLVSQLENCRYLSGFTGSSGCLLISQDCAILATDFRYIEQAKGEAPDYEVSQIRGELPNWLPDLISHLGWHKLGFEANSVSYHSHHELSKTLESKQVDLELIPTNGLVEHLRSIKELEELGLIIKAAELTDAAFEQAKDVICPGMTEKQAAWEIEKFLRQKGSEEVPFKIIVASGPNSALPHARPTQRMICPGEPVLIDMGAKIGGYCSDLSRTLSLRAQRSNLEADKTLQEIHSIVLKAQAAAIEAIEAGMDGSQADRLARTIIEKAGYGDAFGHGLGHGVGIAVHEFPTLGPNSSDLLANGMVFTIEPGIYIPGQGGVRIEDLVTIEKGKVKVLTKAKKDSFQL